MCYVIYVIHKGHEPWSPGSKSTTVCNLWFGVFLVLMHQNLTWFPPKTVEPNIALKKHRWYKMTQEKQKDNSLLPPFWQARVCSQQMWPALVLKDNIWLFHFKKMLHTLSCFLLEGRRRGSDATERFHTQLKQKLPSLWQTVALFHNKSIMRNS